MKLALSFNGIKSVTMPNSHDPKLVVAFTWTNDMKWFLFTMYIASTGGVENWREPVSFDTQGGCSKALIATIDDLRENHPEVYHNRVLICDEVDPKNLVAANEFFFKQFGEVPFR